MMYMFEMKTVLIKTSIYYLSYVYTTFTFILSGR